MMIVAIFRGVGAPGAGMMAPGAHASAPPMRGQYRDNASPLSEFDFSFSISFQELPQVDSDVDTKTRSDFTVVANIFVF